MLRALDQGIWVAEQPLRFLGVEVGATQRRVARLACAGGANVARMQARYDGPPTCGAAALVAGGGKACFWGCLGFGDCAAACGFDAIHMSPHRLPVVDESRCTACGDCVAICPKDLFSIVPEDRRLWVACRSREAGDEMLADCEVGCTACGRCAMDAPDLVRMVDHLPVVDLGRPHGSAAATERCPTGAIVWMDERRGPVRGASAPNVVRRSARHDAPT